MDNYWHSNTSKGYIVCKKYGHRHKFHASYLHDNASYHDNVINNLCLISWGLGQT